MKIEKIEKILIKELIKETFENCYSCTREWSAWSYGTMTDDDFLSVPEDEELLEEITGSFVDMIKEKGRINENDINTFFENLDYTIYYNEDIYRNFDSIFFKDDYLGYIDLDLINDFFKEKEIYENEFKSTKNMAKSEKQKDAIRSNFYLQSFSLTLDAIEDKISEDVYIEEIYKIIHKREVLDAISDVVYFSKQEEINKNIDFYNNNIDKCVEQYESLTFDMVHGDSVKNEIKKGSRILDVGCGTGRDAFYLASNGHKVVAIDPSDEMINYSKKNNYHENIEYIKSSLPSLDNVKGKFDFILISAVWMHLDKDTQKKSIKELKKKMKGGAKMVILVRHGEFSDGRVPYEILDNNTLEKELKELKLKGKNISENKADLLNRGDVYWSKLLIENLEKPKKTPKIR